MTENGTDVLPVAKESRIEKEVDILLGEIIMISVLSSLSFTLLSVIHSFIIMFFAMPHNVIEARNWAIGSSRFLELGIVSV